MCENKYNDNNTSADLVPPAMPQAALIAKNGAAPVCLAERVILEHGQRLARVSKQSRQGARLPDQYGAKPQKRPLYNKNLFVQITGMHVRKQQNLDYLQQVSSDRDRRQRQRKSFEKINARF